MLVALLHGLKSILNIKFSEVGRFEYLKKFVAWKSIFLEKFEPCLKMLVALLHGLKSILNIEFLKVGRFEFLEKFVAWK